MRKKSRLPVIIVCLLVLGFASFNTWKERTSVPEAADPSAMPFIVLHRLHAPRLPAEKDSFLAEAGHFDSDGNFTQKVIPEHGAGKGILPLLVFDEIPEDITAAIEKIMPGMETFAEDHRGIEDLYLEVTAPTVDFEALYDLTHALRLALHQKFWINVFIRDSWIEAPQKNIVQLKNLNKSSRFFVYKPSDSGADIQALAAAIHAYDKSGISFLVEIDTLPDPIALKARFGETSSFAGLLVNDMGETK